MRNLYNILRTILFTKIIGDIDLYTILSSIVKYIFVFIVLYFIYIIVKMIVLDMKTVFKDGKINKSFIKLLKYPSNRFSRGNELIVLSSFLSIGRDPENNLQLDETYISKRHAIIIKKDDGFYVEDLNSSNGTNVNGIRIIEPTKLNDKDVIEIGLYSYQFNLGEDNEKQD